MTFSLKPKQCFKKTIILPARQLLRVERARGWVISAESGTLLLTIFNHHDEVILGEGCALTLTNARLTLVEAIDDSIVALQPPKRSLSRIGRMLDSISAFAWRSPASPQAPLYPSDCYRNYK